MTTPCISDPYVALACFALTRPVSEEEVDQTKAVITKLQFEDPPLLQKFLEFYPAQKHIRMVTASAAAEAEGLLQCIWRGDYADITTPESGPYVHFKGTTYLCYSKAVLLQGSKEEVVIVYSSKKGELFVRPLREWIEIVKWPDGKYRPRFTKERQV
jgi:Protein of unknown function (DUF1653)